jgi:aminopeptidase N
MRKILIIAFALAITFSSGFAQPAGNTDTAWKKEYRYTGEKINNLSHTRLDVRFDYAKRYLYGKAWVTLSPHFYPTDSLLLHAKGMEIHKVALVRSSGGEAPLKYAYDGMELNIRLDRTYRKDEKYTVYIDYTAKPDEFEEKMGNKMLGVKGLYFINPDGKDKNKPTQIWTQGETESSSAWFPTIDRTNQKTTQEIIMTVPAKYVTLSNGKLISQKKNADGSRTDHWKMDLPHAPYLFFMGVGEYAVVKDSWKGKEVSYYVEPEYGPVARRIFGNTPEMMTYFSRITGVDYPWNKYAQMTGRDFVAGAMENTTATLHQESAQQDARELADGNRWEGTIAHELFHQWFGDYVTAENWTNLTLNESFANYSETLWSEYKYGRDEGDAVLYSAMQGYLQSGSGEKNLVRFHYSSHEDMFDAVSYNKGGCILHMLRNHVGDSAFFRSLNHYLTTHKFGAAEAHDLRLSFEKVTGRDLNWFFNQWYYGAGHPKFDITYRYDEAARKMRVKVAQTQSGKAFRVPVAIDVYNGPKPVRHNVWLGNAVDSFAFDVPGKPDLVNFDGDKVLVCEKKENKNLGNYIHQYKYAGRYLDRREAIEFFGRKLDDPDAVAMLGLGLNDPSYRLRNLAISKADMKRESIRKVMEPGIAGLAAGDKNTRVRAAAIDKLGPLKNPAYRTIFEKAISDSSYSVSGEALEAFSQVDSAGAVAKALELSKQPSKGTLDRSINNILVRAGNQEVYDRITSKFESMPLSNEKLQTLEDLAKLLENVNEDEKFKKGVNLITDFRDSLPAEIQAQTTPYINNVFLTGLMNKKNEKGKKEHADYVKSKIASK